MAGLDLAYPTNQETFGEIFENTTSLLVKKPNEIGNMFVDGDWMKTNKTKISLRNTSDWATLIPFEKLCKFGFSIYVIKKKFNIPFFIKLLTFFF